MRLDQKIKSATIGKLNHFPARLCIPNGYVSERHNFFTLIACWYRNVREKPDTNKTTNKSSGYPRLWQDKRDQI
jgi:hypothetical protein